jgi:hypothetical protein
MATAQQIKALLKSYAEGDDERFITVEWLWQLVRLRFGHAGRLRGWR